MARKQKRAPARRGRVTGEKVDLRRCPKTGLLVAARGVDQGTEERRRQLGGVTQGNRVLVATAEVSSIFDALLHDGHLGDRKVTPDLVRRRLDAGDGLAQFCRRAGFGPPALAASYQPATSRGRRAMSDRMAALRGLLAARIAAFGWPRLLILLNVLVFEIRPSSAAEIKRFVATLDAYADLLKLPRTTDLERLVDEPLRKRVLT
jgi:hypothetical protein